MTRPYFGPPSYGNRPPRWGFPPVVWRSAAPAGPVAPELPSRALTMVAALCLATAVVALVAAGAELWRYLLLLQGRTVVLSGTAVRASDRLVGTAAWTATALAVLTAALLAPLLVRLHAVAAQRAGLAPSRVPAAVLARLVVPGWNLYGVGVVAGEIDGQLRSPRSERPRLSALVVALWIVWLVDAVLVLTTLVMAFGTSDQAVADTVELHVFVDMVGAVVAALWFALLRRWRRRLGAPRATAATRWVVRPPQPTRPLTSSLPVVAPKQDPVERGEPEPGPIGSDAADPAHPGADRRESSVGSPS